VVDGLLNKLRGETITGNDLWLTLKPQAQQVAMSLLAGKCGAAVALDPRTGAVQVMASRPTYNPNLVESNFSKILRTRRAPGLAARQPRDCGLFTPGRASRS
jgi:peptidoglycan glycosyltransferase